MHEHDVCTKCGSPDLLCIPLTPADHSHIVVGDRLMRNIVVSRYVCTDCGAVQEWVNSKEDLRRLKEDYHRSDLVPI